eukprot:361838-Chlamydomonas_euryale.AAC.4
MPTYGEADSKACVGASAFSPRSSSLPNTCKSTYKTTPEKARDREQLQRKASRKSAPRCVLFAVDGIPVARLQGTAFGRALLQGVPKVIVPVQVSTPRPRQIRCPMKGFKIC